VLLNDVSMTSLSNTQSTVDMAMVVLNFYVPWIWLLSSGVEDRAYVRSQGGHFEHSL